MARKNRSRFWRWFRLVCLVVILAQFPFVFQVCRTWQADSYLSRLPREASAVPFLDVRGGLHVHSAAGSHSLGTYPEILAAARQAGYRWLLVTEHPKEYMLFQPLYQPDVVMIYGWELEREDGTRELVDPERRLRVWSEFGATRVPEDVNAIELFNLADSAATRNHLAGWMTWLHHRYSFPALFGFHAWELDAGRFARWDETTRIRPLTAVAGNDAHQNLGLMLVTGAGKRWASVFVDPYLESLSFVTNHLQLPPGEPLTATAVIDALVAGASYICFEKIGDPAGFSFHAEASGTVLPMGSQIGPGGRLVFQSPFPVRFQLLRDGREHVTLEGRRFSLEAEPGVFRLEVYLLDAPSLLNGKPWIITNPIYVR